MSPTIYVITYHAHNHQGEGRKPLDPRFLQSSRSYCYYLIDQEVPFCLKEKECILEREIDPFLPRAGALYFAEWSFLLAEYKHAFCRYPFFMISSRFYEKNFRLCSPWDLDTQWEKLFSFFDRYGWGFLPSYDRPLRWIDLPWDQLVKKHEEGKAFFPFTDAAQSLTKELFDVSIPEEYPRTIDLFCNYVGFRSREDLQRYIDFYRPMFTRLFDAQYVPKIALDQFVKKTGAFRNEKPFTFYLELLSHLFFFKENLSFFCLHSNGYYEIQEKIGACRVLEPFSIPLQLRLNRWLQWKYKYLFTESPLHPTLRQLKKWVQQR